MMFKKIQYRLLSDVYRVTWLFIAAVYFSCASGVQHSEKINTADEKRILICGDVMMDWGIKDIILNKGTEYPVRKMKDFLHSFDFCFCNLENPVTLLEMPVAEKKYVFSCSPEYLSLLSHSNIKGVSLANNHIFDYGYDGFKDTLRYLDEHNVRHTGAGNNVEEAFKPLVFAKNGIITAIFAVSAIYYEDSPATATCAGIAVADLKILEPAIRAWRKADIVIVSIHWGIEYSAFPEKQQSDLAHSLIDCGADVVAGHHPHIYQGIEIYKNKPVLYSLGNFIFGSKNEDVKENIVAEIVAAKNGIKQLKIYAVSGNNNDPFEYSMLGSEEAGAVFRDLHRISAHTGSEFTAKSYIKENSLCYDF